MKIQLDQIDADALPRDRSTLDGPALAELQSSIARTGLRQPIDVFKTATGYGLISGYRRLTAMRQLHELTGKAEHASISATLRTPNDQAAALAEMVEENEIRESLAPWDRGRIAVATRDLGHFATIDAAIKALFPHSSRSKLIRLRAVAEVAETMPHSFTAPEALSERQLLRIANCLRLGWGELLETALTESPPSAGHSEWSVIAATILEAETIPEAARFTPNRPKRLAHLGIGVTIRREKTDTGFTLHFTGRAASSALVTEVIEQVEFQLGQP
ncbi:MAG: ParB/RepB/Spo0J family partition protein [Paracoccaceae bacterium]